MSTTAASVSTSRKLRDSLDEHVGLTSGPPPRNLRTIASESVQDIRRSASSGSCRLTALALQDSNRVLTASEDLYLTTMMFGSLLGYAVSFSVSEIATHTGVELTEQERRALVSVGDKVTALANPTTRDSASPVKRLIASLKQPPKPYAEF